MPLPIIRDMVKQDLGIADSTQDSIIDTKIKTWQLYLQPQKNISDTDVHDETKWPELVNVLIAKLVLYNWATRSSMNQQISGTGALKTLKTGPSEAHWYDATSKTTSSEGGILGNFKEEVCTLASSQGIRLPFCPQPKTTHIFIVGKKTKHC